VRELWIPAPSLMSVQHVELDGKTTYEPFTQQWNLVHVVDSTDPEQVAQMPSHVREFFGIGDDDESDDRKPGTYL
jgi:hypothetical protein